MRIFLVVLSIVFAVSTSALAGIQPATDKYLALSDSISTNLEKKKATLSPDIYSKLSSELAASRARMIKSKSEAWKVSRQEFYVIADAETKIIESIGAQVK